MEGLPVRQWRKQPTVVSTAPPKDIAAMDSKNSRWSEHPMPHGSEMYPPWCQALLRAARCGQISRPGWAAEDEKEPGEDDEADADAEGTFLSARWAQVPKDLEQPEPEYLAKRRKGLQSLYAAPGGPTPPMRKTKVKKTDPDGNVSIYEVLVPEGATVEGEVREGEVREGEEVMVEVAVPGTVVEGVGIVNAEGLVVATEPVAPTPPRRRPPPPKRKPKGPGRGRKKKAVTESAGRPVGMDNDPTGAMQISNPAAGDSLSAPGASKNGPDDAAGQKEESMPRDGDDGSEEEDDEGDEGDEGDREEGEIPDMDTPAATPSKPPQPLVKSPPADPVIPLIEEPVNRDLSSSPDVPLAASQALSPGPRSKASTSDLSLSPMNPIEAEATVETGPLALPQGQTEKGLPASNDRCNEPSEQVPDSAEVVASHEPAAPAVSIESLGSTGPAEAEALSENHAKSQAAEANAETESISVMESTGPPEPVIVPAQPAPGPTTTASDKNVESHPMTGFSPAEVLREAQPHGASSGGASSLTTPASVDEPSANEHESDENNTHIPAANNPFEGISAPQEQDGEDGAASSDPFASKYESARFSDGDEDLFGSLEAHLNKGSDEKK